MAAYSSSSFTTVPSSVTADSTAQRPAAPSVNRIEQFGAGSTGANIPQYDMYGGYGLSAGKTVSMSAATLNNSLKQNVYDPWGPGSRPAGGREYAGPWVNPYDTTAATGFPVGSSDTSYRGGPNHDLFKYNQFFMTVAQNFDPFMQKREAMAPHWWLNRIPRGAYQLHNGTIQETRIYRGGLSHYAGLYDWEELAADPTSKDACAPLKFKTYNYAWETLAWSGKRTAWGSDPICIEVLKYVPKAKEQIAWILETGVKFGTAIQNVWNRDMFIFNTVMAQRSYVMTSEYRGAGSPRYVYNPYCKLTATTDTGGSASTDCKTNVALASAVTGDDGKPHPFIVIDATAGIEPLNFDVLDIVRNQLKRRCPDSAVGRVGGELMFALAVSAEDVEKYIRGNEEERKYWIEANPQALIQHYGFAPTTFRRWTITCDDDQLRFKLKTYIPKGTAASELRKYGNVGVDEFVANNVTTVPLWIAVVVDPEIDGRPGINGSAVPVPNPAYDLAEIAIAPVFMNKVFTNLFVPDETNLGASTWFGPKKGLNGKWAWYNIQTPQNPENKIGNFKGEFDIVPKPDVCVYDCISFVYRRCSEPLPSVCPIENTKINGNASTKAKTSAAISDISLTAKDKVVIFTLPIAASIGTEVKVIATASYTKATGTGTQSSDKASESVTLYGVVYESLTGTTKNIQFYKSSIDSNGTFTVADGTNLGWTVSYTIAANAEFEVV